MITCSNFYQMGFSSQADILLSEGVFLQTRFESDFVIDLYELQDLLIEVFYQKENEEPVSVIAYPMNEKLKTLPIGNLQPRLTIKSRSGFGNGCFAA